MGDRRFTQAYERLRRREDAVDIRLQPEETLIEALAGATQERDPYFSNVLATELLNRRRAGTSGARGALDSAVRAVGRAEHICLVYETREEQLAAAIPYLVEGLANRERCIYIVDEGGADAIRGALAERGVDVERAERSGALQIMAARDSYLRGGSFDPDGMIDLLRSEAEAAEEAGFAALRVTGEMTWALGGEPGTERLLEYESKLNRFFPGSRASAICQYDRRRFSAETLIDILHTHPKVVYGGLVCSNSYYVPPEEFLGPGRAERELDRLLENVRGREDAEERLRALNRDLERRVGDRTRELQSAYRDLEAFSYSVSHDLRAPLRGVEALLDALVADHAASMDADARGLVDRARRENARMISLVQGLLALSRIGRGDLARASVDLSALARDVADGLAGENGGPRVDLVVEPGLRADADPRLARIVLDNLLRNAWKFSRDRPAPQVRVGGAWTDGRDAFFVADNGVGFDPAATDRLFSPFQRLHGDRYEGSGIGLATVRRAVERHGGRVWAEGAVDRGATVWFTFS